ncbi:MAG: aconitase X catalytic domain-containing protein [Desulfurococcaceae archaeon]|nr:aconitase X catalytic domain-containing protein [Desulfurococcaceae archaeon]
MYLTVEQEKMLRGDYGWAIAKAMEIIVRVGEALGAEELVKVEHVHVSGISYSTIGKYGLEFIRELALRAGKANVFTTVNPGCIDYSGLSRIIDNSLAGYQKLIDESLEKMRFKLVYTCIPYFYRPPLPGEHLAWGESSAVIFANSIYGGFTNREGSPVALAASLTGYTYKAGLHLLENRIGRVEVKMPAPLLKVPIGAIGLWIGENIKAIPYIRGLCNISLDEVKNILASMAASGNHALAVIEGITPRGTFKIELEEQVEVENNVLEDYIGGEYSGDSILGYIGCPHSSPRELLEIWRLMRKYGRIRRGKMLVTIPVEFTKLYRGIILELKARGVDIATGTCPVVSKFREKFDYILTNSGKALFYLERIHRVKVKLARVEEIVKELFGL